MSLDPISAGLNFGAEVAKMIVALSKFFPDYGQKKLEDYNYHHRRYVEELTKVPTQRDDNRIDYHKDQMQIILKDFSSFLQIKAIEKEQKDG